MGSRATTPQRRRGPVVLPWAASVCVLALVALGLAGALTTTRAAAAGVPWRVDGVHTAAPPVASSFVAPNDVAFDDIGRLVVADFAANGVLRQGTDGTWETIAGFGTHAAAMWNPSAVAALPDGGFVVAEAGRRTVTVLDATGAVVRRVPAPPTRRAVSELAVEGSTVWAAAPGSGALWTADLGVGAWTAVDGPWSDPAGVALTPDRTALVVSDAVTDEVWRLARGEDEPSAESLGFPTVDRARLLGVAVDPRGAVYVVDNGGGRVWSLGVDGWSVVLDAAPDGSVLVNPTAVSVGAGRLAVADYNRQRVVTAARVDEGSASGTASPSDTASPSQAVPSPSEAVPSASEVASSPPAAAPSPGGTLPTTAVPTGTVPTRAAPTGADPTGAATGPAASATPPHGSGAPVLAMTGTALVVPGAALAVSAVVAGVVLGAVSRRRRLR